MDYSRHNARQMAAALRLVLTMDGKEMYDLLWGVMGWDIAHPRLRDPVKVFGYELTEYLNDVDLQRRQPSLTGRMDVRLGRRRVTVAARKLSKMFEALGDTPNPTTRK